jgi:hypothetical protein
MPILEGDALLRAGDTLKWRRPELARVRPRYKAFMALYRVVCDVAVIWT